jgi:superfamily II DNA or RNA helicase
VPLLFDERTYQPQRLRDYQQAAVTAIRQAWSEGEPAPLAALATGAGKTTIIAQLLLESVNPHIQRALVVGHTEEIIGQLRDRIANQFNGELDAHYTDRYAPGIGIVMADNDCADARIVIATRQSLHEKRLRKLLTYGAFDVLLIDEAHHAAPGSTYLDIVGAVRAHNPEVAIAGFTATPKRSDEHALAALWSKIVYQWLIPEGIAAGYLVPVTRVKVTTEVDLSAVKSAHGDYSQNRMVSVLDTANWDVLAHRAYEQHIAHTDRLALAFFPSVEMSQHFAEHLRKQGIAAGHLDGTTPKDQRRAMLSDYSAGKLRVLSNFGVLTEGFDAPATAAILMARPTRSQTLFTQIVGRGLRPFPGKSDCLLVDLAVTDVKALEIGTLLGKMSKCRECRNEYFAGLKACPICGHVRDWKSRVRDGDGVLPRLGEGIGETLIANYDALFEKSFAAWFNGGDGFFSCTLSFEDGAFIIVPPLEDNYYRLALVPKDKSQSVQFLTRNEDLSSLMLDADERVRQKASMSADKEASWREHPASMAQINLLTKMNVAVGAGLSKGAASQLITHHIAVKRLVEEN